VYSVGNRNDMSSLLFLDNKEKNFLLQLARNVIKNTAEGKKINIPAFYSEKLKEKYGVFVSLHIDKELRGCIGYVEGIQPLQTAVMEMAKSAAFHDPRFEPVGRDEVAKIKIEISVLSPLKKIKDIHEIQIGIHGIVIEKGFYKGLLLPQVATEYNWDLETFLNHSCIKAGLSPEAWKSKETRIDIFSAEIFSEK
jgi:AmmeMemoRadiSam system protein A